MAFKENKFEFNKKFQAKIERMTGKIGQNKQPAEVGGLFKLDVCAKIAEEPRLFGCGGADGRRRLQGCHRRAWTC
jgi:hypothetical protein